MRERSTEINLCEINLMHVPKFYFESNQLSQWIASEDDFKLLPRVEPEFFRAKRNTESSNISFGFRGEHTGEETLGEFLNKYHRDVDSRCPDCHATGIKTYGNSTTWVGGIGGQALTPAICDRCWGSGDLLTPGTDLKEIQKRIQEM